jgi:hypothetical protein
LAVDAVLPSIRTGPRKRSVVSKLGGDTFLRKGVRQGAKSIARRRTRTSATAEIRLMLGGVMAVIVRTCQDPSAPFDLAWAAA